MRCWCGKLATFGQEVDPVCSPDATGIHLNNGQPLAPRCDEHLTDSGWPFHLNQVRPHKANLTWWEPTWSLTTR